MRRSLAGVLLFATVGAAPALRAQEAPSVLELYGGYEYVRFNIHANVSGQPPFQTFNGNGAGGQMVYNANNWLGVLGNVAGYWASNSRTAGAAIPYLFGPRANLRRHAPVTPFAQVLLGGVVTSGGIVSPGWQTHFAMTAGGGVDVKMSRHLSIRPVQAEYFMTKVPDGLSNRQDNFRFSTGVVLRLGTR